MIFRALAPADIAVFAEAITTFFLRMTRRAAAVRTAYVLAADTPILWDDFNGVIMVSGGFRGSITFSAPRALLREVLLAMGEASQSSEAFLDVVGEIANQLSGRARQHFGQTLDIAPPTACEREGLPVAAEASGPAYAIPLTWGPWEATLVVHLDVLQRR